MQTTPLKALELPRWMLAIQEHLAGLQRYKMTVLGEEIPVPTYDPEPEGSD